MVLITRCPACDYTCRFADDQAGQAVRCFSCRNEYTLPPTGASETDTQITEEQSNDLDSSESEQTPAIREEAPASPPEDPWIDAATAASSSAESPLPDQWWAQTAAGEKYGPVTKLELDNWVRAGRIDQTFRLRQGQGMWHPATDIFAGLPNALAATAPESGEDNSPFATAPESGEANRPLAPAPESGEDNSLFAPVTLVDDSPFQSTNSSNPFQPPRQDHLSQTPVTTGILNEPSAEQLRNRVQLPALFLIIYACLTLLLQIVAHGFSLAAGNGLMNQGINPFAIQGANSSLIMTIAVLVISLGLPIVTVYGALKMRQLRSYGFAVTACILPMIPCVNSCCCGLALPFSIWGLVVLLDPNVRSLFDQPVALHAPA